MGNAEYMGRSLLTTSAKSSRPPVSPLSHSGLVYLLAPSRVVTSPLSSPTLAPASAAVRPLQAALPPAVPLKKHPRKKRRKKNLRKSPTLTWALISLDNVKNEFQC